MSDAAKEWAVSVFAKYRLAGSRIINFPRDAVVIDDARTWAECVTKRVLLCGGLTEVFSRPTAAHMRRAQEAEKEGLLPIDVLYGRYDPAQLRVEIFIDTIRSHATRFGWGWRDVLTAVRIHEYAHALVHIGVGIWGPDPANRDVPTHVEQQLEQFGPDGITDWQAFRAERDDTFRRIDDLDDRSHELLAQAITWACVCRIAAASRSDQIVETFLELEARQPQQYRIPPLVKARAPFTNWPLVLAGARELGKECDAAGLADGGGPIAAATRLEELIAYAAFPADDCTAIDASLTPFAEGVQRGLDAADQSSAPAGKDGAFEILCWRTGLVEVRMYKESRHPRPHFHIEYKTEHSASYALDSFERLAGYIPRKYEAVILIEARNRQGELAETWRVLNGPAKCIAK